MRNFLNLLKPYHRIFVLLFAVGGVFTATMCIAGCAGMPVWLTDAGSVLTLVSASFTSVAGVLAGISGNTALAAALLAVSAWIQKVQTGIADLEQLVKQYQASSNPTILSDIEAALVDVKANIQTDFSNLNLPSALLGVITQIAALALSQLEAWGSLIPALKAAPMTKVDFTVMYDKNQFKDAVNKILDTPTGDPEVDAALAQAKRL